VGNKMGNNPKQHPATARLTDVVVGSLGGQRAH
jgi:hypothetical protein